MKGLAGKRVLVTAGAAGIGATLVRRFAQEGARLAYCDVDAGAVAAQQAALPNARGFVADVTDPDAVADMARTLDKTWGGVDVLCANAGTGGPAGRLEDIALDDWRATLSVNLDGAFLACRWALPHMRAQRSGCILLTASTAGLFGYPYRSPYAVAKWGIIGLMKTLAMEAGDDGIRVNAICPGSVEGDRMDRVIANEARARGMPEDEVRAGYVSAVSMKSWVSADEVADTALFLASDLGAKISGQAMAVDGATETLKSEGA